MDLTKSQLGQQTNYNCDYSRDILFPIPRKIKRDEINIDSKNLPFYGADIWNHYEVSWLDNMGKPHVAIAEIIIPAISEFIIESKSMKLYFNSLNNKKITNIKELEKLITNDLTVTVGASVQVKITPLDNDYYQINKVEGVCLDELDLIADEYLVNPQLLKFSNEYTEEVLYSNILRSNCLITNQPDWATIIIAYTGHKIHHESLLKYIISYRNHNEFHEQCVERIFMDLIKYNKFTELTVKARFTRRGGIDINPIRSTNQNIKFNNMRLIRQ